MIPTRGVVPAQGVVLVQVQVPAQQSSSHGSAMAQRDKATQVFDVSRLRPTTR